MRGANPPRICRSPLDRSTLTDSMRPYPTATQPQFKLNHKSGGRGTFAAHGDGETPAFYRTNFARAPARQSDGLTFGIPSPAFPRTDSPAFGRPTPIQPFPNPDMDGINRHPTTIQPSLVSNPRATRFRHSHPKSVILQPQPLLQPQPTAAKQTCPQQAANVPRSGSSCNSAMLKMIEILF